MNSFKFYFRKSSFKKDIRSGNFLLKLISEIKPSSFLEIGVLEGVTSRNVCELLNKINNGKFNFIGIDLFGEDIEKTIRKSLHLFHIKLAILSNYFILNISLK